MMDAYARSGRQDDVVRLRDEMAARGLTTSDPRPGQASLLAPGRTVRFSSSDSRLDDDAGLRSALDDLMVALRAHGYAPDVPALPSEGTGHRRPAVLQHGAKVALAYALSAPGTSSPVRLAVDYRLCDDCHEAARRASAIYVRHISVRDVIRHHQFRDGRCSCGEYW